MSTFSDASGVIAPLPKIRRPTGFSGVVPAFAFVGIFFVVPVAILLLRSVLEPVPGLGNYAQLIGSSTYLKIFANTFIVSGLVTVISLVIGFPVDWALAIMPGRLTSVIFAILLL